MPDGSLSILVATDLKFELWITRERFGSGDESIARCLVLFGYAFVTSWVLDTCIH